VTVPIDRSFGPTVDMVIGADPLVSCLPAGVEPDGVAHLRPERAERHLMVLHETDPGAGLVPSAAERLLWLNGRAGSPELVASGRSEDLCEAAVVRMSWHAVPVADPLLPLDPENLARLLGASLRSLHDLPLADCPYESDLGRWRDRAATRVASGEITTAHDGPYARVGPVRLLEVLDELIDSVGQSADHVLIHGAPIPAHTWLVPDGTVAFTGWQSFGVGDRHHDLAVASSALTERFGPPLVPALLDEYGLDDIDLRRLDLHQLLVHLLGMAK